MHRYVKNRHGYYLTELTERKVHGYAIGGLSGGEAKDEFWRMVAVSAASLPRDKPRYTMGVGFAVDLVVCVALGSDMFDCVYPTRTAVSAAKDCYYIHDLCWYSKGKGSAVSNILVIILSGT